MAYETTYTTKFLVKNEKQGNDIKNILEQNLCDLLSEVWD